MPAWEFEISTGHEQLVSTVLIINNCARTDTSTPAAYVGLTLLVEGIYDEDDPLGSPLFGAVNWLEFACGVGVTYKNRIQVEQ